MADISLHMSLTDKLINEIYALISVYNYISLTGIMIKVHRPLALEIWTVVELLYIFSCGCSSD